jgi:uncharacterized protein YrzB (UPF0473 family)
MSDLYGSDFITIEDEDGNAYELEVLTTFEYNGFTYLAVSPADSQGEYEVSILKSVEEDGESILSIIEDDAEWEAVNNILIDLLYEEEEE